MWKIRPRFDVDSDDATTVTISRDTPTDHLAADRQRRMCGRFELRQHLGQGGFGEVYRAYDPVLDQEVALKLPTHALTSPDKVERFLREAKSASRLHHPNIVQVFEAASEAPFYISMEPVPGESLAEYLRREEPSFRQTAEWVRDLASALDYAHQENVIHRDVKPGNLLLSEKGRVRIADFGLAKRLREDRTVTVGIVGTPAYMAPEQADLNQKAGPAADIYAVGAVLYELLTGQPAFRGATQVETLQMVTDEEPARPRAVRPVVPRDLETICLKCLEKSPGCRYPTARDLADDLQRWLNSEPVSARRIGIAGRSWRWCRRNHLAAPCFLWQAE